MCQTFHSAARQLQISTVRLAGSLLNGRQRNNQPSESIEGILCASKGKKRPNKANLTMHCDANLLEVLEEG